MEATKISDEIRKTRGMMKLHDNRNTEIHIGRGEILVLLFYIIIQMCMYLPSTGKYRRVVNKKIVQIIRLSRLNENAIAIYHDAPE